MQKAQEGTACPSEIAIIGGGAAGFFAAITTAEANPDAQVTIYEKGHDFLKKVKVSGGGRCNVTHDCFDPEDLATRYPRGSRELRGAFHHWQPEDTIAWFAERGVALKTEDDGRIFPETDDSQTIIDCFMDTAHAAGVRLKGGSRLKSLKALPGNKLYLELEDQTLVAADAVCIASGSLKSSSLIHAMENLGHTIEPLAPSLFAFNLTDKRTHELSGLSVQNAGVKLLPNSPEQTGPILITHRGLSGPAILRLSAWEARSLQERDYRFDIAINWLGDQSEEQVRERFANLRKRDGKTLVKSKIFKGIPRRLWERILNAADINDNTQWANLPKQAETALTNELIAARFKVQGKTTNKEEFVTCGGIRLKEVDFRRMESRIVPNLFFAGECLDIDGITGGFNFQAAWTTGRIAGLAMAG